MKSLDFCEGQITFCWLFALSRRRHWLAFLSVCAESDLATPVGAKPKRRHLWRYSALDTLHFVPQKAREALPETLSVHGSYRSDESEKEAAELRRHELLEFDVVENLSGTNIAC